ncbi:PQQ-binding-like beta-propeller repeat protein [Microtetraspora sp. NBRC 16547]|uniref:outer membrane protein assembly factor BamB family protein n=1 Tax=Microtetraspora sp. NBRC 16547 TaxID=3030993 RepID=UPI0024A3296E|nr:PQQ-binding-like beta-propeller repeat protein [Microtetraspora sp. NBRC 16547]GLW98845.1 phosphoesterase [Microtetraspora sp. NBRC 16547]
MSTTIKARLTIGAVSGALLALIAVSPGASAATTPAPESYATVNGVVFADANGNGTQDRGERGLANVSVSDGVTTVQTDAQGNYELLTDPARRTDEIVFVSQPTGYLVPVDEFQTPQFYKHLGELTVGQEASASFGLIPAPKTRNPNFTFGTFTDTQTLTLSEDVRKIFEGAVAELNQLSDQPEFMIVSGDLTQNSTEQEFVRYTTTTATSRVPVWPAVGNHDFSNQPLYTNYRKFLGPEWYSFDYGNRHFVVLENTSGFKDPAQLEWMRNDLAMNAKDDKVVTVVAHRPMQAPPTGGGGDSPAPYIELMEQYNTKLVLTGHTHKNDVDLHAIEGAAHVVTNATSSTLDQTPNGFRVVTFKGDKITYPFKMYGVDHTLTVTNPAPGSRIGADDGTVQVNAYNTTSNVTAVHYRIDGGKWKALKQSSAFTWAVETRGFRLPIGEHTIEVRATDDTGRTWKETSSFRVVPGDELNAPRMGSDWSMFKGNSAYTGVAQDVLGDNLELAWTYRTPGTILTSSPVVVDGVVYAGTRDEDGEVNHAIHAIDLATGKQLWRFPTDGQAEATPVVADGIVYAASVRGTLFALDAKTGTKIWSITKGDQVGDGVHRGWMYEPPNYADGVIYQVYSNGERRLMALDAKTGAQLWDSRLNGGWISETPPALGGGRLYVDGDNDWLVALNAKTGAEEWRVSRMRCTNTTPTYSDELLYMGCQGDVLIVLDAATGKEVWRYTSTDPSFLRGTPTGSSPAIIDGVAYQGFSNGNMTALDAKTGEFMWTRRTGGGITSAPVVSGDTLYFGSNDGFVYGLDRATGAPTWKFEIGTWVASSPAVTGNTLVVGAWDGNVYAFTADDAAKPGEAE